MEKYRATVAICLSFAGENFLKALLAAKEKKLNAEAMAKLRDSFYGPDTKERERLSKNGSVLRIWAGKPWGALENEQMVWAQLVTDLAHADFLFMSYSDALDPDNPGYSIYGGFTDNPFELSLERRFLYRGASGSLITTFSAAEKFLKLNRNDPDAVLIEEDVLHGHIYHQDYAASAKKRDEAAGILADVASMRVHEAVAAVLSQNERELVTACKADGTGVSVFVSVTVQAEKDGDYCTTETGATGYAVVLDS
jgi:hypothetical protein